MTAPIQVPRAVDPSRHVAVHAAAGTGKTWLLVQRIARLLLTGAEPDSILAITFTRKAAAEIGLRVDETLREWAEADDATLDRRLAEIGVTPAGARRDAARRLYEEVLAHPRPIQATTFHAFCQELLQRFPFQAEVPADFELAADTADLEDAAWRDLGAAALREPEGALSRALDRLLARLDSHTTRGLLFDFLRHRSDWWAYVEGQGGDQAALDWAMGRAAGLLGVHPDTDPWAGLAERRGEFGRLLQSLEAWDTATGRRLAAGLGRLLEQAWDDAPGDIGAQLGALLLTQKGLPNGTVAKSLAKRGGAPCYERLCALLAECMDRERALALYHLTCDWYRCGAELVARYQRIKHAQGLLDFTDLEWQAYRLLTRDDNAAWIQYKLDRRINHVLVDEFQDTNPTQWQLLQPLLAEILAGDPERARSVFLVGDVKQSIYGWRRAEPGLMGAVQSWIEQRGRCEHFSQYRSRRSAPPVIALVNLVFRDDPRLTEFEPHATHLGDAWGEVEVAPLVPYPREARADDGGRPWRDPLQAPRASAEDRRREQEAAWIVERILALQGRPVQDGDRARPLHWGDVMILLRDRKHAGVYEQALQRAGIPYVGAARGTLLEALEVQDLRHLIRCLLAPQDDLALAWVLRSPLFGLADDDLLALAAAGAGTWRERLAVLAGQRPPEDPAARALHCLERWGRWVDRIPVHDLLDRIYNEGAVVERYRAALPAHRRDQAGANLDRLLELALEMDAGRYPGLQRFLRHLDLLAASGAEGPSEPAVQGGRRVRVMTIHAAKGLEAPAVFLADTGRPAKSDGGYRSYVRWPPGDPRPAGLYLLPRKEDRVAALETVLQEAERQKAREDANLLYVALTRARQYLYISGTEAGKDQDSAWHPRIARALHQAAGETLADGVTLEYRLQGDDFAGARLFSGQAPEVRAVDAEATPAPAPDPRLCEPVAAPAPPAPPEPVDPEVPRRGILLHAILESLTGASDRAGLAERLRRRLAPDDPALFKACWDEAVALVDDPGLADWFDPARYREAHNEVPILYRNGDELVHGVLDRVVIHDDRVVVLDYKTHRHASASNAAALAAGFRAQLERYAAGAARCWPGRPVEGVVLFTRCRAAVTLLRRPPD